MPRIRALSVILVAALLSGCVGKIVDVVTAPVRAGSQLADWATTSQDEADRARGREIRRREEQLGKLYGDLEDEEDDCLDGADAACREAVAIRQEIDALLPAIPVEPRNN